MTTCVCILFALFCIQSKRTAEVKRKVIITETKSPRPQPRYNKYTKPTQIKYGEYFMGIDKNDSDYKLIKIVAISDTHMKHKNLQMPDGDILILSGDYTKKGTVREAVAVNRWLAQIKKKHKYKHILLINGNHEGHGDIILTDKYLSILKENNNIINDENTFKQLQDIYNKQIEKLRDIMTNCIILNDEAIVIENIKFYGSSWCNHKVKNYGMHLGSKHILEKWKNIPFDVDYLITHCPPQGIIDRPKNHYGCSQLRIILKEILNNLAIHQFGHVHGVSGYQFITKQSIINSVQHEQYNNTDFFLSDKHGDKLFEYEEKSFDALNGNVTVNDCVLFINAVNNGKSQPIWFNYPVRIKQVRTKQ